MFFHPLLAIKTYQNSIASIPVMLFPILQPRLIYVILKKCKDQTSGTTFSHRIFIMDLINNCQAKLCISTPTIGQTSWICNIQIHGQIVHIVSFWENKHTPVQKKKTKFESDNHWKQVYMQDQIQENWQLLTSLANLRKIPFIATNNKYIRIELLGIQPRKVVNSPCESRRWRILNRLTLHSIGSFRLSYN